MMYIRPLFMKSYAENVLVLIKVKLMECWADSAWLCIFHFWKCVTQGIKAPFENKAADPFHLSWVSLCHSFSLSLLFFRLIPWSTEALWVHFFAWASKTQSRRCSASTLRREGALCLRSIKRAPVASVNRASPMSGALLAFCVNQGISASFSLLYFLSRRRHPSWGYPWILLRLDPGSFRLFATPWTIHIQSVEFFRAEYWSG